MVRLGIYSALPFEPFGHPLFYLFLAQDMAFLNVPQSTLKLLPDVDVVLDVLERRVVRDLV